LPIKWIKRKRINAKPVMAIISGGSGTASAKIAALKDAGVHVCENLGYIGEMCADVFPT